MNNNNNFNEDFKSKKYKNILKSIKEFLIKHKIITLALVSSFVLSLFFSPEAKPKVEPTEISSIKPVESLSTNNETKKVSDNTSTSSGYTIKNKDMYQKGIDYHNKNKKIDELWKDQASVAYLLSNAIKKTALENNQSESDVADYFYGVIIAIRNDTKSNIDALISEGTNSNVIEYEKKILAFINNILKNYNINYTLTSDEEDKYFALIDNKNAILNPTKSTTDTNTHVSEDSATDTSKDSVSSLHNTYLNIKHGTFKEAIVNGNILVVKAKITPSYNNKATINQNAFNVEDIIKNQGGNQYNEIQYWAVADMKDNSESKVISFTIDKKVINMVANGSIPGNMIINYASDVWILPSLLN